MKLKTVKIFANDIFDPTILITYILNDDKKKSLKKIRFWIREDKKDDFDIINFTNKLYYGIVEYTPTPKEKDIFRIYQELFSEKVWENYIETETEVFDEKAIEIKLIENFIEFHKDFMREFVETKMADYTLENQKPLSIPLPFETKTKTHGTTIMFYQEMPLPLKIEKEKENES